MSPAAISTAQIPTPGLEEVSQPPAGVVLPPRDIRGTLVAIISCIIANSVCPTAIVEKTAGYVARNGPVFEREFPISSCLGRM